ncbi:MAG: hypothetical protein CM15mP65_08510 [Crocinitomicaceae bacterium]|nr:MAG: hypothetical protein CM15mP65_08510 [Crocinitomicaceae bacterium]
MIDVLIIDDVQFFSGKEKLKMFSSTFSITYIKLENNWYLHRKAPVEMQGMEQRLLSRFKWGLSADLQMADLETRIAILQKKCTLMG